MPKSYEEMKKRFQKQGKSEDESQESAAKIFNAKIRKPNEPAMGPNYEERAREAKRGKGLRAYLKSK